ncbi:MAG: transposase [Thiotrichaceae bacterium]|nr:transposase [Thiotrichaceae bacterium]
MRDRESKRDKMSPYSSSLNDAEWAVERSNAWVERCKSLVKNFERSLENANTKLCFIRLIIKQLASL